MADYFTQIKKMWDDYNSMITIPHCNCGLTCASLIVATKMIQDKQLMQFLVGLNDEYRVIRGSILMMKPLPSIDQVYQLIVQEEKQRSLSAMYQISNNAAAFNTSDAMASKVCSAIAVKHGPYNSLNQGGQSRGLNSNLSYALRIKRGILTIMVKFNILVLILITGLVPSLQDQTEGNIFATTVR